MPKDTPPPAMLEEIKLLAPHTHAGRDYPTGARLNLRLHNLDADSAAWLIGCGVAEPVNPILTQPEA